MRFVFRCAVPLAPRETFERLRYYEAIYPDLHPAHQPLPEGRVAEPLHPESRFQVAERFGREFRRYDFHVTAFAPEIPHLTIASATVTQIGPLTIRSQLVVDFTITPSAVGSEVVVTQTISFGRPWLDRLLDWPSLWRGIARHADEECEAAVRLLMDPARQIA